MPSVIIIGAGFGGLGMAIELQRNGFREFTILEKAGDLGGVWRENTYPGAACDVPSPLYSFAHEPKPRWRQRYSGREDIWEYMRDVARRHRLYDSIVFGAEVVEAEFDDDAGQWIVRTADGVTRTADVLVSAVGQLSRPAMPPIPGIASFAGQSFHSALWDHEVKLDGRRVACIGTGASAIQYIPEIQPRVERLTVFQRTAAWVLPKFDTDYQPVHQRILVQIPGMPVAERLSWWLIGEFVALGLVDVPGIVRLVSRLAEKHLEEQVTDPVLRAKLTPDYPIGCKRGLFSNDYYPALCEPNVTVETTAITEIVPEGVRTADGVVHAADVIIYGTGFKGTEFLWPMKIRGRDGRDLNDVWDGGAHAYLGLTVPEFPNLFMVYGPNTNLGVGSIIYMIESQTHYIRRAVQLLAEHPGARLEVRPEAERAFNDALQQRLARTPWNFCTSWYRTASGRITNNWPGTTRSYRRRTRALRLSDYTLEHR
ncbi:NAD(P)/FAD-dependent oxidoreductase [Nocardia yunnanensis]|uniref:NAD(P)/FAD-dependent oxidoreductase n=1 Tax=Nocardia yunnanensis TaxID=2382165 RepID=A0A386Z9Y4_9NOCA|nr:NAD(P)/FAD-dependent oxidoreductase [Nocardia yunnanensis]AYF73415.1 NAD(P)/FAD-dependent oxidoreductase [Nocardia yunnanensis]